MQGPMSRVPTITKHGDVLIYEESEALSPGSTGVPLPAVHMCRCSREAWDRSLVPILHLA